MKLHNSRVNLEVDVPNSKTFSIQSSASAFDILSTLYTDQPLAVVRELMCNAYDAQIAASYDGPAEFHCPTNNEPYLIIRDFGTGMTEEVIYDTYTVMFKSSKSDSNDYTGALGLGAKSPFCIVNNFSVYTYIDGIETVWLVYKNDKGIPSISKIGTNKTNEKNGTKILLDVAPKYINELNRACQEAFQWFKVIPTGNLQIKPPTFSFQTPEYSILPNCYDIKALMGNVLYSINLDALNKTYNYTQKSFLNAGVVLHFNIGELDFVPSREHLKMNSMTQTQIVNRINFMFSKVAKELQSQIDKCENLYEARLLAIKNKTIMDLQQAGHFSYKGTKLLNYLENKSVDFLVQTSYKKPTQSFSFRVDERNPIIIDDLKRGSWSRAKFSCGYCFQIVPEYKLSIVLDMLGFSEEYGFKHNILRKASELPTKPTTQKSRKTAKISLFKDASYISDCWATEVDISQATGYYIELDRYNGIYEDTCYSAKHLAELLQFFKVNGLTIELYGIRKTVSQKTYAHLKPFIPFAKEKFKELCKTTKFEYSTGTPYIKYNCRHLLPQQLQNFLTKNSQLVSTTVHGTINMFNKIGELLNITDRPKTVNYKDLAEEQLSKYQLILNNPTEDHIKKYINLIDTGVLK